MRAIRLQEHERAQRLCVRGAVEVEPRRALTARGVHVEKRERRQVRRRHEEDVRAVRYHTHDSAAQL